MLNGTYKISGETPLGKKDGTLKLSGAEEGGKGALKAEVKIDGIGIKVKSASYDGDSFKIEGEASVLVAKIEFTCKGKVSGDKVKARASSEGQGIDLTGTRA